MLARAFLVNLLAGIELTIWYDWRDPADDSSLLGNTGRSQSAFGLIHCLVGGHFIADVSISFARGEMEVYCCVTFTPLLRLSGGSGM
jgi:hypothetical protein